MQFLSEADEMFTRMLSLYGKSVKKKEKEFLKTIGKEKVVKEYKQQQQVPDFEQMDPQEALKTKRDPSKILDSYHPKSVESFWYKYWETNKYFHPDANEALKTDKRYVMCLPPPNVTGYLHIGHALTSAIEDSLVRIHRQRGYATCYLPGTDHAGIATQSVVERHLAKQNISKWDLGRDEFLKHVWDWKEKHGKEILSQLKRVGSSLDWDRFAFTMDPKLQIAVTEAFVKMHDMGLIYRANRLVNWSCGLRTAISDIEVDYADITKPTKFKIPGGEYEFGWLTYFTYQVKGSDETIQVATTRLETMLGDTAVAVNSKDQRYQHLIGKELLHPFIPDRKITVIADDILVDMNFGTGAVKVTPAHDPNDYECGVRNKLEFINIFDEDGKINENGGQFKGLHRFDARIQVEQELKKLGAYKDKQPNAMRLGFCSRSKDVIEPLIKPQWYVKCSTIKERMIQVVQTGELVIVPEDYKNNWYRWMEGLRDWCISRQLWWGHRCPAYLATVDGKVPDSNNSDDWIIARNLEEAYLKAEAKYGVPREKIQLKQDEDVLDTWFSSGLFPFSTFGWPDEQHPDFNAFFPNTILETGWDILFFWVARMVQFSLIFFNKVPFKYVFLHPIIRDKDGKKMSKTLGNVIDPVEVIDGTSLDSLIKKVKEGNLPAHEVERTIAQKKLDYPNGISECGSDALRFGLLAYMQKQDHINLNVAHIEGYRQFCNKIWQSFRFALQKLRPTVKYQQIDPNTAHLFNGWILLKLERAITVVNKSFDDYEFGEATKAFYGFWLYEFCDVYIESIKNILSDKNEDEALRSQTESTLLTVLDVGMRLLHPMMPFLSEELWQKLPNYEGKASSLCIANYPEPNGLQIWQNKQIEDDVELINNVVKTIRQVMSDAQLPANIKPEIAIVSLSGEQDYNVLSTHAEIIGLLSKTQKPKLYLNEVPELKTWNQNTFGTKAKIYANLKGQVDSKKEIERIEKQLKLIQGQLDNLQKNIDVYTEKTPEIVKKKDSEKLAKLNAEKSLLLEQLKGL